MVTRYSEIHAVQYVLNCKSPHQEWKVSLSNFLDRTIVNYYDNIKSQISKVI